MGTSTHQIGMKLLSCLPKFTFAALQGFFEDKFSHLQSTPKLVIWDSLEEQNERDSMTISEAESKHLTLNANCGYYLF